MKSVGKFNLIGYALVAACSFAFSTQAEPLKGKAVVRAVRGTAQYNAKNQGFKPVKVGMIFSSDTVIRTAPASQVDLFLGDNGPVLRTTEDTDLGLDKLTVENIGNEKIIETQLNLRSGRILGNVKKMAAASRYEVKTPRGVAAIRGTEFDIRADGTVTVVSGTVVMAWTSPGGRVATGTVNPGQTGTPPTTPDGQPNIGPTTTPSPVIDLRDPATNWNPGNNPITPGDSPETNPNPTTTGPEITPTPKPAGIPAQPNPVVSPTTGATQ